jgi:hypothetical protein
MRLPRLIPSTDPRGFTVALRAETRIRGRVVNPPVSPLARIRCHQTGRALDLTCTDGLGRTSRTAVRRLRIGCVPTRSPPAVAGYECSSIASSNVLDETISLDPRRCRATCAYVASHSARAGLAVKEMVAGSSPAAGAIPPLTSGNAGQTCLWPRDRSATPNREMVSKPRGPPRRPSSLTCRYMG